MSRVGTDALTPASFGLLIERLDADPDRAAEEYERLRRSLVRFFDWRGAWPADECADATIDRLCRRLEDGTAVDDLRAFARGIARMLLHERQRGPAFSPIDEAKALPIEPGPEDGPAEQRHACFDRCLDALPADSRALVLDYYQGDRSDKIANRRRLAAAAGLSDNPLRSRVQRIRDRLERCVRDCVASADGEA